MWMISLERDGTKPTTVEDLQTAMVREFVPPDERARAKTRLMTLKLTGSVDSYVSRFRDLVEICGTPLSEAYFFFFNGLSDVYKEEFTKHYPTGDPPSIQQVYEHARTIELARQWSSRRDDKSTRKPKPADKPSPSRPKTDDKRSPSGHHRDASDPKWGPAKPNERNLYRRQNRCFHCGVKWQPGHRCNEEKPAPGPAAPANDPKA